MHKHYNIIKLKYLISLIPQNFCILFDQGKQTPVSTTVRDADGIWKIEDVEKGAYDVVASKEGLECVDI